MQLTVFELEQHAALGIGRRTLAEQQALAEVALVECFEDVLAL